MKTRAPAGLAVALILTASGALRGQDRATLSDEVRSYVAVSAPLVALENVLLLDGTGGPARPDHTILIRGNRIEAVGPSTTLTVPTEAERIDLAGHTVMPGMVGLHNHMFYYQSTPRTSQMQYTGPRLYLGAGVTTVRTTGSVSPYQDISLKSAVERGDVPGPRLHITSPYVISPGPDERLRDLGMYAIEDEASARRYVQYWAAEGATWVKAYTQITREALGTVIDEAHKQGMKVTAHLCSVGFREAAALGIDNLEHGLWANSEYDDTREPDTCSPNYQRSLAELDMDDPAVGTTIRELIESDVAVTSTLAVAEQATPLVPDLTDRDLAALPPHVVEAEMQRRAVFRTTELPWLVEMFENMLTFELAFVEAGGTLAAGVDPAWGALPGYGDQRNFEILVEAGFEPAVAVQIVTANGAKVLGIDEDLGTVEVGKLADLLVIDGDIDLRPSDIRNIRWVFKDGIGYDSAKLIAATDQLVGVR